MCDSRDLSGVRGFRRGCVWTATNLCGKEVPEVAAHVNTFVSPPIMIFAAVKGCIYFQGQISQVQENVKAWLFKEKN